MSCLPQALCAWHESQQPRRSACRSSGLKHPHIFNLLSLLLDAPGRPLVSCMPERNSSVFKFWRAPCILGPLSAWLNVNSADVLVLLLRCLVLRCLTLCSADQHAGEA